MRLSASIPPSDALIRPRSIDGLDVEAHPGWTPEEQRKIDVYMRQPDLFSTGDRAALQPPRFWAFYRYRCHDAGCGGHRQGVLDWELVTFQRKLADRGDAELRQAICDKFLGELCAPGRDVAFYVGNQAKRAHVFSVLGVYWPPRASVPAPSRARRWQRFSPALAAEHHDAFPPAGRLGFLAGGLRRAGGGLEMPGRRWWA